MPDADCIGSCDLVEVSEGLYRISPRSSFADFLGRWLFDPMPEFKAPAIP